MCTALEPASLLLEAVPPTAQHAITTASTHPGGGDGDGDPRQGMMPHDRWWGKAGAVCGLAVGVAGLVVSSQLILRHVLKVHKMAGIRRPHLDFL